MKVNKNEHAYILKNLRKNVFGLEKICCCYSALLINKSSIRNYLNFIKIKIEENNKKFLELQDFEKKSKKSTHYYGENKFYIDNDDKKERAQICNKLSYWETPN